MARPRKDQALDRLAAALTTAGPAVEAALPAASQAAKDHVNGSTSIIVQSGQAERVIALKLAAWPHTRIAAAIGVSPDAVDRYVKTPHYLALYEQRKAELLGKVLGLMQDRLLEVGMEALEVRLYLMRNAKNKFLRDKVAKDLMELALEVAKGRGVAGGAADKLLTVLERIKKRRLADGTEVIEKVRFKGQAGEGGEALAAQLAGAAGAAPAQESGADTGPDGGSGEVGGEARPPEAEEGPRN